MLQISNEYHSLLFEGKIQIQKKMEGEPLPSFRFSNPFYTRLSKWKFVSIHPTIRKRSRLQIERSNFRSKKISKEKNFWKISIQVKLIKNFELSKIRNVLLCEQKKKKKESQDHLFSLSNPHSAHVSKFFRRTKGTGITFPFTNDSKNGLVANSARNGFGFGRKRVGAPPSPPIEKRGRAENLNEPL